MSSINVAGDSFGLKYCKAGLPALQGSQPGQVRKEAATTIEASAGG